MAKPWTLLLSSLLAAASPGLRAAEVSLEENKAARGNIGYVDMQRLFRLYPETQKAKQNFEEVMRQAEEQVNIRKAELIGLRAEIIKLRLERDLYAKAPVQTGPPPSMVAPAPQVPAAPPAPSPSTSTAVSSGEGLRRGQAPEISTAAAAATASTSAPSIPISTMAVQGAPAAPALSTATAAAASTPAAPTAAPAEPQNQPLVINLPGLSSDPIVIQPPSAAGGAPTTASLSKTLADLEAKVADKTRTLQEKEAEFKTYQAQVEKNLLELEGKKTEILLGKIYTAVQEVAHEEGVSVLIDKSQILFGQKAVDLTEKVLKKLRG